MVVILLAGLFASSAAAHPGHPHLGQRADGRQPGVPDLQQIGDTTYRYRPGIGQYEIKKKGRPPSFAHYDDIAASEAAEGGPNTPLQKDEYPPHCRTSGHRVVVVHTHRSSEPAADSTMKATLRSIVRRMTSKIYYQSITAGSGKRTVELAVDCNAEGQINVYDVVVSGWDYATVSSTVMKELGEPEGTEAVKYLTFDHKDQGGGIGGHGDDADKNQGNLHATATMVAIAYRQIWETHVPMHELFHNFGASQGDVEPPPPYSTLGDAHCVDGLDILCYEEAPWYWEENEEIIFYSETRCPASEGYDEPWKVPIDCKYDTYFDTVPEEGTWLAEYWNTGGAENPFLVAPPEATTEATTDIIKYKATMHGTVNPEGTDTDYYFEYGTDQNYGSKAPVSGDTASAYSAEPVPVSTTIEGLEHGTTYHYRLVATNDVGTAYGEDETFVANYAPTVTIEDVEFFAEEDTGKAILKGTINPNGFATGYHFVWGEEWEHKVPLEDVEIGFGETPVPVEQEIEGLAGGTLYGFALVAENTNGEENDVTILNSPYWRPETSLTVLDLGIHQATLGATIDPEGFETTYRFEWGEDEEYGNSIPIPDGNVGSGQKEVEVSQTIKGLKSATTYYYRLIAENANGQSFFTHPGSFRTLGGAGFVAEYYPVPIQSTTQPLHIESPTFYLELECEAPVFGGEIDGPSSSVSAHGLEEQSCDEGTREFDMNGCELVFYPSELSEEGESEGQVGIEPPGCGPITIENKFVGIGSCPIEISSQQVFPVNFKNEGEGEEATVAIELNEDAAPKYSFGGSCWPFYSELEDLTWEGSWEVSATDPETEYQFGLQVTQIFPTATTEPATDIVGGESASAKLNGAVLPTVSGDLEYYFEYGTSGAYGSTTEPGPVEGEEELSVSETVEGLSPDTVYHYRLVVSDEEEEIVSYGQDRTFLAATPELEPPGEEFPASFSLAGEEEVVLRGGESLVECITVGEEAAVGGEGQFEDETSGTATLTLHNCKSSGTNCTTPGEEVGTIKTDELPFDLLYLSDGKPGVLFLPNAESERLAMVKCAFGLVEVEIAGSGVLAQITDPLLGQSSSTMSIDLDATEVGEGEYAQEYTETHSGAEYGLQVTINEGKPGAASLEAGAVATFGGDVVLALVGSFGPALEPSGEEFPAAFSLVGEDEVVLRSGESSVECKTGGEAQALGGEGEFEDAASGTATLTLHNCKSSGTSCTTSGEQLGTIKAEGLRFHLIYLSDGEPGVVLLPNAESGQLATAKCAFGLVKVEVAGNGVLAQITDPALNEVSQALTLDLDANEVGEGEYAQEYTEIEAGTEYGLQVTINEGNPGAASLEAEATASFEGGEGELVE
jgi:hypothetical protein